MASDPPVGTRKDEFESKQKKIQSVVTDLVAVQFAAKKNLDLVMKELLGIGSTVSASVGARRDEIEAKQKEVEGVVTDLVEVRFSAGSAVSASAGARRDEIEAKQQEVEGLSLCGFLPRRIWRPCVQCARNECR